jgi:integrase
MPPLRKRTLPSGKVHWDIRYRIDGKQKIYTIGETDRRTAEKIYNEFCRRNTMGRLSGERIIPANNQTSGSRRSLTRILDKSMLSDLAELTREYAVANKSPKTVDREQLTFTHLIKIPGNIPVCKLTSALIEKYKFTRMKEVSGSTIRIEIRILNTSINQAKELKWGGELPERGFKQLKLPDAEPPQWLDEEQIQLVLANADTEFKSYLQFLLHTGCRRNEALGVTWADTDLQRRQIIIRGEVAKMGKRRSIPLNDVLYDVLYAFTGPRMGPLFPSYGGNQLSMKFRRLAKKVNLPEGISLHSLRATFGSTLINKGVDIYTVSKLLGHSSVKVTEKHYLALDPAHVKEAINQLEYGS